MMRRTSVWMLIVVLCFYGVLILDKALFKKTPPAASYTAQSRVTFEELKGREEIFKKNMLARPRLLGVLTLGVLTVLVLGLVLNVYGAMLWFRGRGRTKTVLSGRSVPWGTGDLGEAVLFLFFIEAVTVLGETGFSLFWDLRKLDRDFLLMLNSIVRDLAVAAFVIYRVRRRFARPLETLGLTLKDFRKNVLRGLVGYTAAVPWLVVLFVLVSVLIQVFSYEPSPQPVVEMYLRQSRRNTLLFFTFFVALAGPFLEEIFFRGFAYTTLRARFGVRSAMVATAAIFAVLHLSPVAFLPIFFLGLFLAYLYEKTGSLVPSMTAHGIHNLIMVLFTLGFKSLSG
jgi:membrane protease YdiL (CAAX protease family)